jgi:hypothetical protein
MTDMRHIRIGVIALLIFGMVIALTSIVCAETGVNATPETQSLGTTTTADVVGLVMETDAGVWTLTNNPSGGSGTTVYVGASQIIDEDFIDDISAVGGTVTGGPSVYTVTIPDSALGLPWPGGPGTYQEMIENSFETAYSTSHIAGASGGIHTGALDPGQIQYTTAYDANIVAQGGRTSFVKQMNLQTGNKVISQSNLIAKTGLAFAATSDGGNVVGSENLMLDGAGMNTTASDKLLCPFAAGIANAIPAYCNIVQAGSKFDLTTGSVTTQADNAFVHSDATIPVVLNYNINVKPYSTTQGQVPAAGSTSAYIKAHIQEARGNGTAKAEDLVYSETSSASGRITAFNKLMSYSSQVTGSSANIIHTITPIGSGINPSTPVTVPDGGSATFFYTPGVHGSSFTPTPVVYYWLVDGKQGGTNQNFYTFTNVVSDHTISHTI